MPHAVIYTIISIQIMSSSSNSCGLSLSLGWNLAKFLFEMNVAAFQGSIILALHDETNLIIPHTAIHSDAESKCAVAIKQRSQGKALSGSFSKYR